MADVEQPVAGKKVSKVSSSMRRRLRRARALERETSGAVSKTATSYDDSDARDKTSEALKKRKKSDSQKNIRDAPSKKRQRPSHCTQSILEKKVAPKDIPKGQKVWAETAAPKADQVRYSKSLPFLNR
jgi:hypothetical protein